MVSGGEGERGTPNPRGDQTKYGGGHFAESAPRREIHEKETVQGDLDRTSGEAPSADGQVADVDEFKRVLVELGLLGSEELGAFEVELSSDVLGLARALVRGGRLTPYQSAAIYQRKSRGLLIGRYLILEKLGQGGMGVVFKARQRTTGKVVALKILPPSFGRDHQAVSRFKREIEAAGRLDHPNIVAALDADEDRGVHFLVMDYVEGRDLDRVVATSGPLPVVQAVDCLIQAARGLEAAHAQGIVHRDIKPGNLMLDAAGNVRVLDLGLARIVEAANPLGQTPGNRLTRSGMYMGTIDYMAPEQAEDSRRADHRADIYSLGCTFHYLLTGQEPFPGETILKRLIAHQDRPAPRIRAARPDAPLAVETVFQKMMAKQPSERPATMTELIGLLALCKASAMEARTTAGEAPKSRPELKVFDEPLKRARPARTEADPSMPTLRDELALDRSKEDLRLEDLAIDVRSEPLAAPLPASARSAHTLPNHYYGVAVAAIGTIALVGIIVASFTLFSGTGRPRPETASESTAASAGAPSTVPASSESRDKRTISPQGGGDSRHENNLRQGDSPPLITGGASSTTPSAATTLAVSYVETARFVGHADGTFVEVVRLLPDGNKILTAGQDETARLWDLKSGREIRRLRHPAGIRAALVLPDGQRAVTGCNDGFVRLWDLQTGREIRRLVKHDGPAVTLAVSPDGHSILSGGNEPFLRLCNVETGGELRQIDGQAAPVWSLAIARDGKRMLSGGYDGIVRVGDLNSAAALLPLERHSGWVFGVAFAPDDGHAVSSCIGQLILWDLGAKKAVHQKSLEDRQLAAIALADSHRVVFCSHFKREDNGVSNDGRIGTWDFESDDPPRVIHRGPGHLSLALLPDGAIATSDVDGFARIWEPSAAVARARESLAAGNRADAVIEYGKAIANRPNDAWLLIERGRLLAELGRAPGADADFNRAAELAPDNPALFLNTGWWVAGPYPPNFELAIDSASATDPSMPPPPAGGEPRRWKRLPGKASGQVDMTAEFASFDKNAAGYAMAIVYSATQRQAVLLIGTDDLGRVWFDGRQILETTKFTPPGANPIEVTLQAGRNTILARVVNTAAEHELQLRISDAAADFLYAHFTRESWQAAASDYARALAEEPSNLDTWLHHRGGRSLALTGRWKEAIPAYKRAIALNPGFIWNWYDLIHCELAIDDVASLPGTCREMIEKLGGTKNLSEANSVAWLGALAPGAVRDYKRLLSMIRPLINAKRADWAYLNTYGALLYRDRQYVGAISYLKRSIEAQKNNGTAFDWVFIAMARHHARQPGDNEALATAKTIAEKTAYSWTDKIAIDHLLEEARRELALPR